jgi:hypothetical protein
MKHIPFILYALFIILGILLLLSQAYSINTISHDDAISYLAATGHQGLYQTSKPAAQWIPARAWQSFWTPDRFWCFRNISTELAMNDIHPPLYFWCLHIVTSFLGVELTTGPI